MTPASVHYRRADAIGQERQQVLNNAFSHHPERFVKGPPIHPEVPHQAWTQNPIRKGESVLGQFTDKICPKIIDTYRFPIIQYNQ